MVLSIRDLPFPPMWVNAFIVNELKKYSEFQNVLVVPSTPTAIDDIYKNTLGPYPDVAVQYDRLLRFRRSPSYYIKTEQLLYYVYGLPEQITDAIIVISQLLDRSDAAAEDLNKFVADMQAGRLTNAEPPQPPLVKNPLDPNSEIAEANVYFHDMKVYQLEEARDLTQLATVRGLTLNKLLIEYDYHYGGITPLPKQYT
jgi:hypothetical protein